MADNDNRDRWGEKLRDNERAREEQYFAERERELLTKLRKRQQEEAAREQRNGSTGDEKKGNG